MKELEKMAIEELLKVYTSYIRKKIPDRELEEAAKRVYNEYTPGFRFLRSDINDAVAQLFSLGYPDADRERKVPTMREAKERVKKLKELKKEFDTEKK